MNHTKRAFHTAPAHRVTVRTVFRYAGENYAVVEFHRQGHARASRTGEIRLIGKADDGRLLTRIVHEDDPDRKSVV